VQLAPVPAPAAHRSYARAPLAGRSVFQSRAAAEVAETAAASTPQQQQARKGGKQDQQQEQQQGAAPNANPYEGVELPTSDESEELLRIRHSVSYRGAGIARADERGGWQLRLRRASLCAAHARVEKGAAGVIVPCCL
jgi:hypothetical protein